VTAALAAVLSRNAALDGEDAQEIVRRTAQDNEDYGVGWDEESGWG
jgi:hypothetical protein